MDDRKVIHIWNRAQTRAPETSAPKTQDRNATCAAATQSEGSKVVAKVGAFLRSQDAKEIAATAVGSFAATLLCAGLFVLWMDRKFDKMTDDIESLLHGVEDVHGGVEGMLTTEDFKRGMEAVYDEIDRYFEILPP